jgi:hypothetical protein
MHVVRSGGHFEHARRQHARWLVEQDRDDLGPRMANHSDARPPCVADRVFEQIQLVLAQLRVAPPVELDERCERSERRERVRVVVFSIRLSIVNGKLGSSASG